MTQQIIPQAALNVLRQARWNKDAVRELELLSLSFFWSDELIWEAGKRCMECDFENHSFKDLLLYRESLIRGVPDERYRPVWDQVHAACPNWPGFSADRCTTDLRAALDSAIRRQCAGLERALREDDPTET